MTTNQWKFTVDLHHWSLPGPCNAFVVTLRVDGQDADPRPYVDQQQRIGVLQCIWPLDAAIWVSGVFKVVALWGSAGHHRVDVQHPPDQTVQLIKLVKLQVCHLFGERKENTDNITEGIRSGDQRRETGGGGKAGGVRKQEPSLQFYRNTSHQKENTLPILGGLLSNY